MRILPGVNITNMVSKISKDYSHYILTVTLLLSLALGWYVFTAIVSINLWWAISSILTRKNIVKISNGLKNFDCYEIHRLMRDSLQLVKWRNMIELGYDSRANTNIILQEERNQQISFSVGIHSSIIKIMLEVFKLAQMLVKIKSSFLVQQQSEKESIKIQNIDSFQNLFTLSREIDTVFGKLHQISLIFEAKLSQSCLDAMSHKKFIDQFSCQVIPLMDSLTHMVRQLRTKLEQETDVMELTPKLQRYLMCFLKDSDQQGILDQLNNEITFYQESFQQKLQNSDFRSNFQEKSSDNVIQHPKEPQIARSEVSTSDRKQFMKKLDSLLMIGLARKRQEQFEKKMRLLEQQQTNGQHLN